MQSSTIQLTTFIGGAVGPWKVDAISPVKGESLSHVERVAIYHSAQGMPEDGHWFLKGVASHVRYVEKPEKIELTSKQAPLGRLEATRAALIPIRKSPSWWELTQDERRRIFESESNHIGDSMKYLPAIARQLYQSRDLGEPFDFLTWFEYAPAHSQMFEELVQHLRRTREWTYVEREIDIRLSRQ
jgi:hypothetical protein